MRIFAGRTFFAFKKRITYRRSQVAGFSISVFIFNDYSEWGKNYDTVLRNTRSPSYTEDSWCYKKCVRLAFQKRLLLLVLTTNTTTITTTSQLVWYEDSLFSSFRIQQLVLIPARGSKLSFMSAVETSADIAQYYVHTCQLSFKHATQALMYCTSEQSKA